MKKKIILSSVAMLFLPVFPLLALGVPTAPSVDGIPGHLLDYISLVFDNIINVVWIIFGGFAVVMFVYAGYLFLHSRGEPSGIKGARDALIWGAVGVGIALMAEIIPSFVKFILNF